MSDLRETIAKAINVHDLMRGEIDEWELADRILAIPEISAGLSFLDQWMNVGPQEREAIIANMRERQKAEHFRPDLGHSITVHRD